MFGNLQKQFIENTHRCTSNKWTKSFLCFLFFLLLSCNCFSRPKKIIKKVEIIEKVEKVEKTEKDSVLSEEAVQAYRNAKKTPTPTPPTQECLINISMFNEWVKEKQYAGALGPWKKAYKECPAANKAIYVRGREILQWKLSQVSPDSTYKKDFSELMTLHDNRIKYFGKDKKYPRPWILGQKGLDYIRFIKNDSLKKTAYHWLETSIDSLGENTEIGILRQFMLSSTAIFRAEPVHAGKYIADYLKTNKILEKLISNPANNGVDSIQQVKDTLDRLFGEIGVADCKTLDNVYATKIAENIANIEFLTKVIYFYKLINCTSSKVYYEACVAQHKMNPQVESANECGELSYKRAEFVKAIGYYEEGTNLSTDKIRKATFQQKIAQIYYGELNSYQRAREYARNSIALNPNNGAPYLLIGLLYAKSKGIYDDPILSKTVFWVAIDKFLKAKEIDTSENNILESNKLIDMYKSSCPSKEDISARPNLQIGKTFFVGGWINESTDCR